MDKYATCFIVVAIVYHIESLRGEVSVAGNNITLNNTDTKISGLIILFENEEIDNIVLEWDPPKTPEFDYFYEPNVKLGGSGAFFEANFQWNKARTIDERKHGSGQFVIKAMLDTVLVKRSTRTITVFGKPDAVSLILNYDGEHIIRNNSLELVCDCPFRGNPEGDIVWIVNGTEQTSAMFRSDVITFDHVKPAQNGEYVCFVRNSIGEEMSNNRTVLVKWKPDPSFLTLNPAGYIMRGRSLNLTCSCVDKGSPAGVVRWNPDKDAQNGIVYNTSVITINKVNAEHGREWTCYYENEVDMGQSSIETITVKWPPGKADLTIDPESVDNTVKRGQRVELQCKGDPGQPRDKVLWMLDSNVIRVNDVTQRNILNIEPSRNQTWSCFFRNEFANGTESDDVSIFVLMTPLKPNITLTNRTAVSLITSITPNVESELGGYNHTNITLEGTSMSFSELQPAYISEYAFYNLEPGTVYNISVFYNNDIGDGEPAFETFITKPSPVLTNPSITRNVFSLTALVETLIENPDSVKEIQISVCSIGERDTSNCNTETMTEITGYFSEGIYGSFAERLVNISMYDNGVQVYTFEDEIGLAVGVIALVALAGIVLVIVIVVIIVVVIKKKDSNRNKQEKEVEENIDPYSYSNTNNESRTGTGHVKTLNDPPVYSVANKGKPLAPISASPADGPVYSKVDWSKKNSRQSLKGSPMSKKAIDKIMFDKNDEKINMQFEVSKKFTGVIEIDVCREGEESPKRKVSKQHVRGTKNVVMVLPMEETSQDKYDINMKFIVKGQMVQEVDLTYPYEQNAVHVTVMNDAYVTSGTDVKASEMPEYSEVNKSKKTKGSEMPIYSEVNKPKKKKKAAEEQPYEDVETKNQSSHNERSTNAVSPSNAEVAVEGVPPHPPRKGAPKEGVMYAELDLNSSGAPRLLPRLGSKSPAQEPVIYADVRPGQKDVV